jgi:hypothetical protein
MRLYPKGNTGKVQWSFEFFCKILDLFHSYDTIMVLNMEVRNYAALQNLQGVVIPRVC